MVLLPLLVFVIYHTLLADANFNFSKLKKKETKPFESGGEKKKKNKKEKYVEYKPRKKKSSTPVVYVDK